MDAERLETHPAPHARVKRVIERDHAVCPRAAQVDRAFDPAAVDVVGRMSFAFSRWIFPLIRMPVIWIPTNGTASRNGAGDKRSSPADIGEATR
jgi:hypothetical protein